MPSPLFTVQGACPCCGPGASFVAKQAWLRDNFVCTRCESIPRERALMWAIDHFRPDWRECVIHESSPCTRGASARLRREAPRYIASQYFADLPRGTSDPHGVRSEDIEQLSFPDESIDLHISQDVIEHGFDPALAFREIARTLRPGGLHVFTTPLVNKERPSEVRARRNRLGEIVVHQPPEYHGNPISSEGSLVTMRWGYDIVDHIHAACGLVTTIVHLDAMELGIRAEYIEVLVTRKPIHARFAARLRGRLHSLLCKRRPRGAQDTPPSRDSL